MGQRKITNVEIGNPKLPPAHSQVGWPMDGSGGRAAKQPPANVGKFPIEVPDVPAKTRVTVKNAKEKTPAPAREGLHKITHGESRKQPADVRLVAHNPRE